MTKKAEQPRPAHRPSRREEIIDAALRVFSREGYTAASVEDIAQESGVAATAIYYHFGGKDELFNQALRTALDRFSESVYEVRQQGDLTAPETLRRVIRAGWLRTNTHPAENRFLLQHTFRPTPEARKLQQDWEERHVERSLDYLPPPSVPPRTPREARVRHAARLLASRVMVHTTIVGQESRLAGGPLAEASVTQVAKAVEDVCIRIVTGAAESEPVVGELGEPEGSGVARSEDRAQTQAKPARRSSRQQAADTPRVSTGARKAAAGTARQAPKSAAGAQGTTGTAGARGGASRRSAREQRD